MREDHALAAEWWEKHSNSPKGADYARRIREGDEIGLGHGQYVSIIRKGEARAKAMGLKLPKAPKAAPHFSKTPTPPA